MDRKRRKIALECVDLDDLDNSVKWFIELARAFHPYTGRDESFRRRLVEVERTYKKLLRPSRRGSA
jgi:hypothetical protein